MRKKYVLYFYSAVAFRQVVLPAINNADHTIRLSAEQFQFQEEALLCLEIIENIWYLNWQSEKRPLCDCEFLKLRLPGGELLSLITLVETSIFCVSRIYQLPGEYPITIGSTSGNVICYNAFQLVSASHAVLYGDRQGYYIEDKSKNGVYVNGKRMEEKKSLNFGDCIDLFGLRLVFLSTAVAVYHNVGELQGGIRLRPYMAPDIAPDNLTETVPVTEHDFFHRRPRQWKELDTGCIEIEAPAAKKEPERQSLLLTLGPALTMTLPLLVSAGISLKQGHTNSSYLYMGLLMAAVTAFISIFWGLANWYFRKKESKWEEKRRKVVYKNYLQEMREYIAEKYQSSRDILLKRYPLYSSLLSWEEMQEHLWCRNPGQQDFLHQRIGLGEMPSTMEIRVPRQSMEMFRDDLRAEPERMKREYAVLKEIPVCVDLKHHRVIGIAGGRAKKGTLRIAVNLLLQIAVNNCYTDVKIAFLYNQENTEIHQLAQIVKWLPHTWAENREMRYLAGNRTEAGQVLHALGEICRKPMQRHYILLVENQSILDGEPFNRYIFSEEEHLRLTTVFLEEAIGDMPNGCSYFLQNDQYFAGVINAGGEKELQYDRTSVSYATILARKLAGIRVKENRTGGELKEYLPFLSLFSEQRIEDMDIAGKWRKSRINESIRVPIGQRTGNRPLYLDIHEKYHGPHGLIAGTTGSGKSETLQTYLLSLAMHFSPEDVAFFIIDYKGGGMGHLFGELPHTVGTVSNLSGNQIQRALTSIKSENQKRQRQFLACGINHINQYTAAYKGRELDTALPHLFIIVDEFAELKREEPEFMKELVSVAQVGRSLGVHLILATQKPAGVVDDNIWSNTRFRLCLRVQDRQDSMDMLHRADAASLTGTGRCYLQVGNDEVFELFQAAYSGAVYEEEREEITGTAQIITRTGKSICEYEGLQSERRGNGITQLEKVIEHIKEISCQMGYIRENKMWMPLLPEKLNLEELERPKEWYSVAKRKQEQQPNADKERQLREGKERQLWACVGLCDHPGEQSQYTLGFDLCREGNVLVCGGPATGKSTLLQTLLYSLMDRYTPQEAEFYLIDCSSRMLRGFAEMPHVAGMAEEEPDKWERIFYRLRQELKNRKKQFAGGSFMHMSAAGKTMPSIILTIDNYPSFRAQTKEKYDAEILQMAAEGKNNGIYLIVTAAGIGISEVPGKLAGNFGYRLALEMGDTYLYGEILRVSRPEVYPEAGKRGRGIVKEEDGVLEFQTALALGEENDFIRMQKIKQKSEEKRKQYPHAAKAIPEIPAIPGFTAFYTQAAGLRPAGENKRIPIGYEQESGSIYQIPLDNIYCYFITGRKGSGKTNLLKIICRMIEEEETIFIDFSSKKDYDIKEGICHIRNDEQLHWWLEELSPIMQKRNQSIHAGNENRFSPIFVMIDNFADFCRHIHHPEDGVEPMGTFAEHLWKKGSGHGLYWFAAWNPETEAEVYGFPGSQVFMGYGTGLHLGGNPAVQRSLVFDDLSYAEQNKPLKPGIALVPPYEDAPTAKIILPLVETEQERRRALTDDNG